jgi:hypothetical protein
MPLKIDETRGFSIRISPDAAVGAREASVYAAAAKAVSCPGECNHLPFEWGQVCKSCIALSGGVVDRIEENAGKEPM